MNTVVNGHAHEPQAQPTAQSAVDKARAVIDAQIKQVVGVNIRGLLVSAPGLPPHELLNAIARVTGALLAGSLVADLSTNLRMRKGFKDAFADGIANTPVKQPELEGLKRA